ncbi:hypothetical protein TeGR_g889 [Tetraparma gracilis]|uniref:START domain-containing protein n=1 Tax=Tetraparma gracilis TaxID=2962635 RepID=A0ABQ6MWT0_9STRA|nr:hypothetical protein TeGR_g889 [Tetraparma gracilis]
MLVPTTPADPQYPTKQEGPNLLYDYRDNCMLPSDMKFFEKNLALPDVLEREARQAVKSSWVNVLTTKDTEVEKSKTGGDNPGITAIRGASKMTGVNPEVFFKHLTNTEIMKGWMDNLIAARLITSRPDLNVSNDDEVITHDIIYNTYRYPGILSNRDALSSRTLVWQPKKRRRWILWRSCHHHDVPVRDKFLRTWTYGCYMVETDPVDPNSCMYYSFGMVDAKSDYESEGVFSDDDGGILSDDASVGPTGMSKKERKRLKMLERKARRKEKMAKALVGLVMGGGNKKLTPKLGVRSPFGRKKKRGSGSRGTPQQEDEEEEEEEEDEEGIEPTLWEAMKGVYRGDEEDDDDPYSDEDEDGGLDDEANFDEAVNPEELYGFDFDTYAAQRGVDGYDVETSPNASPATKRRSLRMSLNNKMNGLKSDFRKLAAETKDRKEKMISKLKSSRRKDGGKQDDSRVEDELDEKKKRGLKLMPKGMKFAAPKFSPKVKGIVNDVKGIKFGKFSEMKLGGKKKKRTASREKIEGYAV